MFVPTKNHVLVDHAEYIGGAGEMVCEVSGNVYCTVLRNHLTQGVDVCGGWREGAKMRSSRRRCYTNDEVSIRLAHLLKGVATVYSSQRKVWARIASVRFVAFRSLQ